jgi:hypothetical protein
MTDGMKMKCPAVIAGRYPRDAPISVSTLFNRRQIDHR